MTQAHRGFVLALAPAFVLAGVLAAASPALADRRIEHVYYNPEHIVTVHGQRGVETMVEFGSDEHVENIAVGDSAAWQVTPNKRANMTVITDRRRYLFDLVATGARGRAIYAMRFDYPEQLVIAPAPLPAAQPTPAPTAPPPPPVHHTGWRMAGDRVLIPAQVYDDGNATYIAWKAESDLPAILAPGPDGSEGPVNLAMKDGTIIIDGVAPRYILRIGKASVTLTRPAREPQP